MMLLNMKQLSGFDNFIQLMTLLIIFVIILAIAYFITRWIAKASLGQVQNRNIKVIETFKVTQNQYIQLVKVGNKYLTLGISKDRMDLLTELPEDQVILKEPESNTPEGFKDILSKISKHTNKNDK